MYLSWLFSLAELFSLADGTDLNSNFAYLFEGKCLFSTQ